VAASRPVGGGWEWRQEPGIAVVVGQQPAVGWRRKEVEENLCYESLKIF